MGQQQKICCNKPQERQHTRSCNQNNLKYLCITIEQMIKAEEIVSRGQQQKDVDKKEIDKMFKSKDMGGKKRMRHIQDIEH